MFLPLKRKAVANTWSDCLSLLFLNLEIIMNYEIIPDRFVGMDSNGLNKPKTRN